MGYRCYIFEPDAKPSRVPHRILNDIVAGQSPKEWRGRKLPSVNIHYTTENKRPKKIWRMIADYLAIKPDGFLDLAGAYAKIEYAGATGLVPAYGTRDDNIYSLSDVRKAKEKLKDWIWEPTGLTAAEVDLIVQGA